ncbi:MAG TPA: hypothetical protein VMU04_20685 [Candidatus Acidoferrum sp.]|nr:hypothetical protein [Candidatus Acidoferrum sp.]
MTRSILPTDIDLAKRLLGTNRGDAAVIRALVQRGIESDAATQLVADLRRGEDVEPQFNVGLGIAPVRLAARESAEQPVETPAPAPAPGPAPASRVPAPAPAAAAREPAPAPAPARRERVQPSARPRRSAFWALAAVPLCFVVVITGSLISRHLHREAEDATTAPKGAAASARPSAPAAGAAEQDKARQPGKAAQTMPVAGVSNAPAAR